MSKYLMNKLIHLVNMNESAEDEYTANPRAFVEKWEKTQKLKLEPEEREALATKDYGKLYALGAHPFTLWSFTEAVWVHEKPREELMADYKAKAAKAGYPNFKTCPHAGLGRRMLRPYTISITWSRERSPDF